MTTPGYDITAMRRPFDLARTVAEAHNTVMRMRLPHFDPDTGELDIEHPAPMAPRARRAAWRRPWGLPAEAAA